MLKTQKQQSDTLQVDEQNSNKESMTNYDEILATKFGVAKDDFSGREAEIEVEKHHLLYWKMDLLKLYYATVNYRWN